MIYLFIYWFICLFVCLFVFLMYLFVYLSVCLLVYLTICLFLNFSISLFFYFSIYLFIYLSLYLFISLFLDLFNSLFLIYLCVYLYIHLNIYLLIFERYNHEKNARFDDMSHQYSQQPCNHFDLIQIAVKWVSISKLPVAVTRYIQCPHSHVEAIEIGGAGLCAGRAGAVDSTPWPLLPIYYLQRVWASTCSELIYIYIYIAEPWVNKSHSKFNSMELNLTVASFLTSFSLHCHFLWKHMKWHFGSWKLEIRPEIMGEMPPSESCFTADLGPSWLHAHVFCAHGGSLWRVWDWEGWNCRESYGWNSAAYDGTYPLSTWYINSRSPLASHSLFIDFVHIFQLQFN